jgi:hypothetical protein
MDNMKTLVLISEFSVIMNYVTLVYPQNPQSPRSGVTFHKNFFFTAKSCIAQRSTLKLEDRPFSAARYWSFSTFAATLHIWRPSALSATWGRYAVVTRDPFPGYIRINITIFVEAVIALCYFSEGCDLTPYCWQVCVWLRVECRRLYHWLTSLNVGVL